MPRNSKTSKEDATVKIAKINQTGILIGLLISAIIAPILLMIANKTINLTATPTPTFPSPNPFTSLPTETPIISLDTTPSPVVTETLPPLPSETPLVVPTLSVGTMNPGLQYNYATGKVPLQVTFNAHSSYLSYQDGTIETCDFSNVCSYSWEVRQGSTPIYGPESGGSVFSYTFGKKGDYTVVVYVCRGAICNFAAASITAK